MPLQNNKYPSRQEVIDRMAKMNVQKYTQGLENWKTQHYSPQWKRKSTKEKMVALEALVYAIYYKQDKPEDLVAIYVKMTDRYALHVKTNTILLNDERASILSTLHEVGHAIFGEPEVDACAFSVKLFAKVFPKEYSKLTWHGHMMKLPS